MLTKKEHRRLMRLITFMESLPREANKHFDMGTFLKHTNYEHEHEAPQTTKDLLRSCGTTACAMGWAATMPYFKRLGCRFNEHGEVENVYTIVENRYYWQLLFGGEREYKTPKQWARCARALVKKWGVE
jgi:hypothetical protein